METIIEFRGSQFLKDKPYSCQWTSTFSIFQRFFKVEAAFLYSENRFFNTLYPPKLQTDFLPSGNSIFLVSAISLLVETIIGIKRKQLWEKDVIFDSGQLIFWLVEIIFFSIFQKLLPVIVYFPSNGSVFFTKYFIPTRRTGFFLKKWKPCSFSF